MSETIVDVRPDKSRFWLALPFIVAIASAAVVVAIMVQTGGGFGYLSEEASVHLALGAQIAKGHYGVEPGEASAPVASILWPLMLAPFASTPAYPYVPFIIEFIALLGAIALTLAIVGRMGLYQSERGYGLAAGLGVLAILLLNTIPLLFLGTGQMVGVFVAVLVLHGLVRFLDTGRMPWWLVVGIIVAPALQYSLLCVSVAAIMVLLIRKRFGVAFACVVIAGVTLGAYSALLIQLGLAPIPASAFGYLEFSSLHAFLMNARDNVSHTEGRALAVVCGVLLVQMIANRRRPQGVVQLFGVVILLGHFLFGDAGGNFLGGVTPVVMLTALVLLYSHDAFMRRIADSVPVTRTLAVIGVVLFVGFARHITLLSDIPSSVVVPFEVSTPEEALPEDS